MEICFLEGNGTDLELIYDPSTKLLLTVRIYLLGFIVESLEDTISV